MALIILAPLAAPASAQNARALLQAATKPSARRRGTPSNLGDGWLAAFGQLRPWTEIGRGRTAKVHDTIDYGSKSGRKIMCVRRGTIRPGAAANSRSSASSISRIRRRQLCLVVGPGRSGRAAGERCRGSAVLLLTSPYGHQGRLASADARPSIATFRDRPDIENSSAHHDGKYRLRASSTTKNLSSASSPDFLIR